MDGLIPSNFIHPPEHNGQWGEHIHHPSFNWSSWHFGPRPLSFFLCPTEKMAFDVLIPRAISQSLVSFATHTGIIKGDEIMVINGALVGDLDMMYIESVLQEELILSLTIRSCRAEPPDVTCLLRSTDDLIDSLVCPPPPSDQLITDDILSNLIVPAPSWRKFTFLLPSCFLL